MPLYLVRWPSLHASLVRARDEDELLMILDEVADPGGCTYQVYRGPIWIDLELPFKVRDITPDKPDATDPSDFTVDPEPAFDIEKSFSNLRATQVLSDTSEMMSRKMARFAFPNFARFLERREENLLGSDDQPHEEPYPEALRAALVADLGPLVRHLQTQKAVATQEGIEAEMMRKMRVTSMLPSMRDALRDALRDAPARKAD